MNTQPRSIALPTVSPEREEPHSLSPRFAPFLTQSDDQQGQRNADRWLQIGITLFALLIYGLTMCRTIYTGDDGDFITAMATLGNCHPTGYPVFVLLGHVALTLLAPFLPDPASRINALTVLFGGIAIGLFYRFLATLRIDRYLCTMGALFLAFTPTLWQQSLSCEVYALTAAYLCGLLSMAAAWRDAPGNNRLLQGMALLYGFALTNNLIVALLLPGFLMFVVTRRPALFGREWKTLPSLIACFLAPLAFYLYLPWSAMHNPPVNWGDPSTLSLFLAKVTGEQYRHAMFQSHDVLQHHIGHFLGEWKEGHFQQGLLLNEFSTYLLWLVPFGIAGLWKRGARAVLWLLLFMAAVDLTYAFNYNIFDVYVYFIPCYIAVAALITVGAAYLISQVFDRLRLSDGRRDHYRRLLALIAVLLPIVHMSVHYSDTDQSGNRMEADFGTNILHSSPPNAIVITSSALTFTLWYQKFVLHERPDVVLIDRNLLQGAYEHNRWYFRHVEAQYPEIRDVVQRFPAMATRETVFRNDFLFTLLDDAVKRGRPVIWVAEFGADSKPGSLFEKMTMQERVDRAFVRRPWGIAHRLFPRGTAIPPETLFSQNRAIWDRLQFTHLAAWAHADPLQVNIGFRYADAFMDWGRLCERTGHRDLAATAYRNALTLYDIPEAHKGLERCGDFSRSSP